MRLSTFDGRLDRIHVTLSAPRMREHQRLESPIRARIELGRTTFALWGNSHGATVGAHGAATGVARVQRKGTRNDNLCVAGRLGVQAM